MNEWMSWMAPPHTCKVQEKPWSFNWLHSKRGDAKSLPTKCDWMGLLQVITFLGFKMRVCIGFKKGYMPPLASIQKPRCKSLPTSKCDLMMILITPCKVWQKRKKRKGVRVIYSTSLFLASLDGPTCEPFLSYSGTYLLPYPTNHGQLDPTWVFAT